MNRCSVCEWVVFQKWRWCLLRHGATRSYFHLYPRLKHHLRMDTNSAWAGLASGRAREIGAEYCGGVHGDSPFLVVLGSMPRRSMSGPPFPLQPHSTTVKCGATTHSEMIKKSHAPCWNTVQTSCAMQLAWIKSRVGSERCNPTSLSINPLLLAKNFRKCALTIPR